MHNAVQQGVVLQQFCFPISLLLAVERIKRVHQIKLINYPELALING